MSDDWSNICKSCEYMKYVHNTFVNKLQNHDKTQNTQIQTTNKTQPKHKIHKSKQQKKLIKKTKYTNSNKNTRRTYTKTNNKKHEKIIHRTKHLCLRTIPQQFVSCKT